MKLAATLILLPLASFAAGDAPLSDLVPQEWRATVIEVTCHDLHDCCGIDRDCCPNCDTSHREPAPVPLPWPGLMLIAALGLLWRIRC